MRNDSPRPAPIGQDGDRDQTGPRATTQKDGPCSDYTHDRGFQDAQALGFLVDAHSSPLYLFRLAVVRQHILFYDLLPRFVFTNRSKALF